MLFYLSVILVVLSTICVDGQVKFGHWKDTSPNILSPPDPSRFVVVIPDRHQIFPTAGKILNITFYSNNEIWDNKLQLVSLKFDTSRDVYTVRGLSGWIDTNQISSFSGWKRLQLPGHYMEVKRGEIIGLIFSKSISVPYHTVQLGKRFTTDTDTGPYYYCDSGKLFEYAPFTDEVRIRDTLVPNRLENQCRIYSYYFEFLSDESYINYVLKYSYGTKWQNGLPKRLIQSYVVTEVEQRIKSKDVFSWNFTAPSRIVDRISPIVVFQLLSLPPGDEYKHSDGYYYCENGGVEITEGNGEKVMNVCSDSTSKWGTVYSSTPTLLVRVKAGEKKYNFHAEVYAGTADDVPDGYYGDDDGSSKGAFTVPWNYVAVAVAGLLFVLMVICLVLYCNKRKGAIGVIKDEDRRVLSREGETDESGVLEEEGQVVEPTGPAIEMTPLPAMRRDRSRDTLPPLRRESRPREHRAREHQEQGDWGGSDWGVPLEPYPWGPPPSYRESISGATRRESSTRNARREATAQADVNIPNGQITIEPDLHENPPEYQSRASTANAQSGTTSCETDSDNDAQAEVIVDSQSRHSSDQGIEPEVIDRIDTEPEVTREDDPEIEENRQEVEYQPCLMTTDDEEDGVSPDEAGAEGTDEENMAKNNHEGKSGAEESLQTGVRDPVSTDTVSKKTRRGRESIDTQPDLTIREADGDREAIKGPDVKVDSKQGQQTSEVQEELRPEPESLNIIEQNSGDGQIVRSIRRHSDLQPTTQRRIVNVAMHVSSSNIYDEQNVNDNNIGFHGNSDLTPLD